jgi:hypothetical protein
VDELDSCFVDVASRVFAAYEVVPAFKRGELAVTKLVPLE